MSDYDYKEKANKLRAKRNFGGLKLNLPMGDMYDKKLSEQCENLEAYKYCINIVLDELEKQDFEDEVALENSYYWEIEKIYNIGLLYIERF